MSQALGRGLSNLKRWVREVEVHGNTNVFPVVGI